jgi:hypothetical protein
MRCAAIGWWAVCVTASAHDGATPKPRKPERPETKRACLARGGKWILYPMGQFYFCALDTSDANKPCSDDRECQGDCIPAERRAELPGICSPTFPMPGGCPTHLVNGKIIVEPCI